MPTKSWLTPAPPAAAIEIASRRVTVVELAGAGRPGVVRHATEPLPDGAVIPSLNALNLVDPVAVAAAIEQALAAADMAVPARVALVVPDSIARVTLLPLEQVPTRTADLDQLVRWQVRKATPFALDQAQVSYFPAFSDGSTTTLAAVVARRDVVAEYEAVATHLGMQPGLVDLASFNVMNTVIGSGSAPASADWLFVHLTDEATTLAILRGASLMFYRHRTAVDEEPLGSLVHQTAMYHEDRLGGGGFAHARVSGDPNRVDAARREMSERLGIPVEIVDVRGAVDFRGMSAPPADVLAVLAAPIGALVRDRVTEETHASR